MSASDIEAETETVTREALSALDSGLIAQDYRVGGREGGSWMRDADIVCSFAVAHVSVSSRHSSHAGSLGNVVDWPKSCVL